MQKKKNKTKKKKKNETQKNIYIVFLSLYIYSDTYVQLLLSLIWAHFKISNWKHINVFFSYK